MKQFLIPLLACGLPVVARAQAPPGPGPDTARVFKHELGLTASPSLYKFFVNNTSLPVGLLYKRHLSERNALRLRVVGSVSTSTFRTNLDFPVNTTFQDRVWYVSAFVGWEANRQMGHRWEVSYGAELGASVGRSRNYAISRTEVGYDPLTQVTSYQDFVRDRITTSTGLQARGFASLGLRVWRTVRVFAETAVVAASEGTDYKIAPHNALPDTPLDRHSSRSFSIRLLPVQFVGISAKF